MKKIFLLCLFPVVAYAQQDTVNCDSYIQKNVDKFTGKVTIASKDFITIDGASKENARLLMMKFHRSVTLNFQVYPSAGCVDEAAEIDLIFSDSSHISVRGTQKFNCDGIFNIYIGGDFGNRNLGKILIEKKISAIRFQGMRTDYDFDVTQEVGEIIRRTYNCLERYKDE